MNKKFLLVAILMAMAIIAQAQSRKKKSKQKTSYALGISSGYFLHGDMFEESENTFSGYKTFQIDVQKYGKGVKSSIGLDLYRENLNLLHWVPSLKNPEMPCF
ncbi:MAG: hypothetical protein IPJ13_05740 [Saprospiraceae bacterium]|nr:hypothetical protein [Saprospiraceae bacterium]